MIEAHDKALHDAQSSSSRNFCSDIHVSETHYLDCGELLIFKDEN